MGLKIYIKEYMKQCLFIPSQPSKVKLMFIDITFVIRKKDL